MSDNSGPVKEEPRTKNVKELIEVLSTKPETPMLDQESPKNDFFILQDFWPVFKFFQILGLFPCKKETDEKGAIHLKPIGWWIPVIIGGGFWSIFVKISKELLLRHLISSSKEASDYFNSFGATLFSSNSARSYASHFFSPILS